MLPYLGGARVFAKDRALRVADPRPEIGFFEFEIEGRNAKALERAEPEFQGMPKVTGHFSHGWLFGAKGAMESVLLLPEEEPSVLSPVVARREHGGLLVFEGVDFDGDAEVLARGAFEERRSLSGVKGAAPSLRAAFGFAVIARVAKREDVPVSPAEVRAALGEVAEGGEAVAREVVLELERVRKLGRVRVGAERRVLDVRRVIGRADAARVEPTLANAADRAEAALESAGATMLACRRLGEGRIEVSFRYGHHAFVSVADALTLQVLDAGICLVDHEDGHRGDEELTLDSLPSAIREAIDLGALVITRRR